jgi:ATP-binding cassette, subfamily B, bacterial PglK
MSQLSGILRRVYPHLSKRRKWQLLGVIMLTIVASFAEILSLGAVIPFIAVLENPDIAQEQIVNYAPSLVAFFEGSNLPVVITSIFCIAVLFAMIVRLGLVVFSARFTFGLGSDLSCKMMDLNLDQDYQVHLNRNSSDVISGMTTKTNSIIYSALVPTILLFNSFITVLFISTALILMDPLVGLVGVSFFVSIYLIISSITGLRLRRQSKIIAEYQTNQIRYIQEGIGGIRDVIISGLKSNILKKYSMIDKRLRRAHGNNQIISLFPRYLLEGLGVTLIAAAAYVLTINSNSAVGVLPMLGAYALGAQRILPAMQNIYVAWANVSGDVDAVFDALGFLEQPVKDRVYGVQSVDFSHSISIRNVDFCYTGSTKLSLNNISLEINKGDRVGIFGTTGSGKSTFIDILMCLNSPTSGCIFIDSTQICPDNLRGWQSHIAHVPQKIFLVDGSVAENVAFGIPADKIDRNKVRVCLKKARLADFIPQIDNDEDDVIGERGARLSGGQVQRIGIARALYLEKDVIVFDEATSALDSRTEAEIMDTIYNLSQDLTLIIIAHRLSTLDLCNKKFEFTAGSLIK